MAIVAMMLLLFVKLSLLTSKEIDKGRDRKRAKEGKEKKYKRGKKIKDREGGLLWDYLPLVFFSPSPNT